jgi:hypothetical protein
MRKTFTGAATAAALLASLLMASTTANAGYRNYVLCWTNAIGQSQCVHLPRNYRLPGIAKPRIPDGRVTFTLTRTLINCILRRYVPTADMLPAQEAIIYAPKN